MLSLQAIVEMIPLSEVHLNEAYEGKVLTKREIFVQYFFIFFQFLGPE